MKDIKLIKELINRVIFNLMAVDYNIDDLDEIDIEQVTDAIINIVENN